MRRCCYTYSAPFTFLPSIDRDHFPWLGLTVLRRHCTAVRCLCGKVTSKHHLPIAAARVGCFAVIRGTGCEIHRRGKTRHLNISKIRYIYPVKHLPPPFQFLFQTKINHMIFGQCCQCSRAKCAIPIGCPAAETQTQTTHKTA